MDLEKIASVNIAGKDYKEADFASLSVEKWAEALGDDFVEASKDGGVFKVATAIEIASTLPLPEAKILSEYLEGSIEKSAAINDLVPNPNSPLNQQQAPMAPAQAPISQPEPMAPQPPAQAPMPPPEPMPQQPPIPQQAPMGEPPMAQPPAAPPQQSAPQMHPAVQEILYNHFSSLAPEQQKQYMGLPPEQQNNIIMGLRSQAISQLQSMMAQRQGQ